MCFLSFVWRFVQLVYLVYLFDYIYEEIFINFFRRRPGETGLSLGICNFFHLDETEYSTARGQDQSSRFVISVPKE